MLIPIIFNLKIRHVYTIYYSLKCENPRESRDSFGGLAITVTSIKRMYYAYLNHWKASCPSVIYLLSKPEWASCNDGDDVGDSG